MRLRDVFVGCVSPRVQLVEYILPTAALKYERCKMNRITPNMSLLQIVELSPQSEDVFHEYDHEAGCCLLCNNLFDSLEEVARIYSLDLNHILTRLEKLGHETNE